eukprot:SAG31_NODE_206_length_20335_cov_17.910160_10_plen_66_part_00
MLRLFLFFDRATACRTKAAALLKALLRRMLTDAGPKEPLVEERRQLAAKLFEYTLVWYGVERNAR